MKRNVFTLFAGLVAILCFSLTGQGFAQTAGTLTFTVNLVSHNAGYGLDHVTAIWVKNASNTFVKTRLVRASGHTLNSHVPVWKANSSSNTIDATTGATLSSYSPITVTWNATNVSAALVPDAPYRVMVEFTWDDGNANHDTTSVVFTKGTNVVHLTPADKTNFTGMVLDWVPLGTSVQDIELSSNINVYPNPTHGLVNINFAQPVSGCKIEVTDQSGALVYREITEPNTIGVNSIDLSQNANGVYYINIQNDSQSKVLKYKVVLVK